MKTSIIKVIQERISNEHIDSFWYDGLIATKGDYELIACGDIRFYYNDKDGNYLGMYDGKCRDNFPEPKNDKDLENMYLGENGFICDENNWFEILDTDGNNIADIYGNYDEAIKALMELE